MLILPKPYGDSTPQSTFTITKENINVIVDIILYINFLFVKNLYIGKMYKIHFK